MGRKVALEHFSSLVRCQGRIRCHVAPAQYDECRALNTQIGLSTGRRLVALRKCLEMICTLHGSFKSANRSFEPGKPGISVWLLQRASQTEIATWECGPNCFGDGIFARRCQMQCGGHPFILPGGLMESQKATEAKPCRFHDGNANIFIARRHQQHPEKPPPAVAFHFLYFYSYTFARSISMSLIPPTTELNLHRIEKILILLR